MKPKRDIVFDTIQMFCVADSKEPQRCAIPKGTHKSIFFEKESKREKKGKLETHKLQRVECAKSMKGQ
jgi:hypothetical protein